MFEYRVSVSLEDNTKPHQANFMKLNECSFSYYQSVDHINTLDFIERLRCLKAECKNILSLTLSSVRKAGDLTSMPSTSIRARTLYF